MDVFTTKQSRDIYLSLSHTHAQIYLYTRHSFYAYLLHTLRVFYGEREVGLKEKNFLVSRENTKKHFIQRRINSNKAEGNLSEAEAKIADKNKNQAKKLQSHILSITGLS